MRTAVVTIVVLGGSALLTWMLWAGLRARGPWQGSDEEPGPAGADGHDHGLTARADAPAGPGAEAQYVAGAGDPAPGPPRHPPDDADAPGG